MHQPSQLRPGVLTLAATPIGNDADASARLRDALLMADVIAAEDTRRLRLLVKRLAIPTQARIVAMHEHNEADRATSLLDELEAGCTLLVVSDAGMPAVSDPGYRIVSAAIARGIEVSVIPGPSAVLAALAVCGLPSDRFTFEGFLPRKEGEKKRALAALESEERTMVFFESPRRLAATLGTMAEVLGGGRRAVVCRELTKTHEEIVRQTLAELCEWAQSREVLGEIVVVVAGKEARTCNVHDLVPRVLSLADSGMRLKDAAGEIAMQENASKRLLYEAALRERRG